MASDGILGVWRMVTFEKCRDGCLLYNREVLRLLRIRRLYASDRCSFVVSDRHFSTLLQKVLGADIFSQTSRSVAIFPIFFVTRLSYDTRVAAFFSVLFRSIPFHVTLRFFLFCCDVAPPRLVYLPPTLMCKCATALSVSPMLVLFGRTRPLIVPTPTFFHRAFVSSIP